jgi:alginate O-acetyltransferase complex protein AlgJ
MMKTQYMLCVVFFVVFLTTVTIQTALHSLPEPILHGVFNPAEKPVLTLQSWFSGRFQQQVQGAEKIEEDMSEELSERMAARMAEREKGIMEEAQEAACWFNERLGFRSFWIKTDNQVNFSVFHEIHRNTNSRSIVPGKDNWLYQGGVINNLLGFSTASTEQLEQFAVDLERLQEELQQRGVTMLVVVSPSKAVHYPEYLPDWVWPLRDKLRRQGIREKSDYEIFGPSLDREGVNWVDAPMRFRQERTQQQATGEEYRLFPQGGTHWSHYGASLVSAEILDRLEELTGKDLTNLIFKRVFVDRETTGTDNDLGDLMNTWTPWVFKGPTPHALIVRDPGPWRPTILWLGKSHSEMLIVALDPYEIYKQCDYLFYFRWRYIWPDPDHHRYRIDRDRFDWQKEFQSHDVVIIELNEAQLDGLAHGFVEGALNFFDNEAQP